MLPKMFTDPFMEWVESSNHQTPSVYYSQDIVKTAVARLKNELGIRLSFSTKANSHPLVLSDLRSEVDEFNVTNLSDLNRLLNLNICPSRISWIHPVVSKKTIQAVIEAGVKRFVVDDERGLNLLNETGENLAITLRLAPFSPIPESRSLVRFGADEATLLKLAELIARSTHSIEALSFFIGFAGIGERDPFSLAIEKLSVIHEALSDRGIKVPAINIGGGFPGSQRQFYLEHRTFFSDLKAKLLNTFDKKVEFICEPGRYIIEASFIMASRVIADRFNQGRRLITLDASAYTGLFETSFIDPDDTLSLGYAKEGELESVDLLGPIMDSFDVIKRGCQLPKLADNDLVLLANVGAYAMGYSNQAEGLSTPEVIKMPDELSRLLCEIWYE